MRARVAVAALAALAALVLLPACGAEEEPAAPSGPRGPLTANAIGPAEVGMTAGEVERVLGRPERKRAVSLGTGPAPEVDWIWTRRGFETRLLFETRRGTLAGYCTDDPDLRTPDGVHPRGATLGMLRRHYGDRLNRSPIGPEGPVPANYLLPRKRSAPYPALAFAVAENSEVASICGGLPRPAGD
jgi:hypothetical protein